MKLNLLIFSVILIGFFKPDFAVSENRWILVDTLKVMYNGQLVEGFFGNGIIDMQTVNKKDIIIQARLFSSYPRVFVSNDTGKTWNIRLEEEPFGKSATGGKQNNYGFYPMAYPNENLVVIGGDSGCYWRSTNNGENWNRLSIETSMSFNSMRFFDPNVGIAILVGSIGELDTATKEMYYPYIWMKTIDGGLTWSRINGPNLKHKIFPLNLSTFENGICYVIEIGLYYIFDADSNKYIGFHDSTQYIYKSTDYGETWETYKGPEVSFDYSYPPFGTYYYYNNSIWFRYGGAQIWPSGGFTAFIQKTTDAGRTWHYVLDTIHLDLWGSSNIVDMSFCDSLNGIATAYTTIWKTTDGGETWRTDTSFHPTSSSKLLYRVLMIDKHTAIGIPDVWGYVYRWTEDNEVSINEQSEGNGAVIIFPNPASDYIYINSTLIGVTGGVWQYQIYDILGNSVQEGMIESDKINISQLSAGFYTVRFFNGGKQLVEKLMKE